MGGIPIPRHPLPPNARSLVDERLTNPPSVHRSGSFLWQGVTRREQIASLIPLTLIAPEPAAVTAWAIACSSGHVQFGWGNVQPQGTPIFDLPRSSNHGVTQPVP